MPIVQKIVVPEQYGNGMQLIPDDPLADAVPVTSLLHRYFSITIYGKNRTGKTTLASWFPKPAVLLSYEPGEEGGTGSIRNVPGISFIRITSKSKAVAIARRLEANPQSNWHIRDGKWWPHLDSDGKPIHDGLPFQTTIHDTCTSLQDVILKELMKLDKAPVQLAWGSVSKEQYQGRSEQAKEVMRLFRDLRMNAVFVAQERDHNKPQDWGQKNVRGDALPQSFFGPDLGEATAKWMYDACSYVCHLHVVKEVKTVPGQAVEMGGEIVQGQPIQVETGRMIRRLRTLYHVNYMAGSRSADWTAVPEYIECHSPQLMYEDVMRVVKGERAVHGHYPPD